MSYETQNALHKTARRQSTAKMAPTNSRILNSRSSIEVMQGKIARAENTTPIKYYDAMGPNYIKSKYIPIPNGDNKSETFNGSYTSFPRFRVTRKYSSKIVKNCAQKFKFCLTTASDKLLTGIVAMGDFYHSEQKWSSEYRPYDLTPFEHGLDNPTPAEYAILSPIHIHHLGERNCHDGTPTDNSNSEQSASLKTSKPKRASLCKRLQTYWKPTPAPPFLAAAANIPSTETTSWEQWSPRWELDEIWHHAEDPNYHREFSADSYSRPEFEYPYRGSDDDVEDDASWLWDASDDNAPLRQHVDPDYSCELDENASCHPRGELPYSGGGVYDPPYTWDDLESHRLDMDSGYHRELRESYRPEFEFPYRGGGDTDGNWEEEEEEECGLQCDGLEASGEMCYRHGSCAREAMAAEGA